jgi:hypothetical protein
MSTLQEQISAQLSGMLYISEGEALLELAEWPEVKDAAALKEKIAALHDAPSDALQCSGPEAFLQEIRAMADASDPVMTAYAQQYEALLGLLRDCLKDLQVIRVGTGTVHIYLAGFREPGCLAVHTTGTET